ncbi:hypothetical protein EPA93_21155 [Ktedonosporobacter rubrisoli]|uniref:Uncharacterized protein n=1 Tax=Ktedonosporobacter rubrisoli TaxID=2509675 RepID=A0A4P6JSW8_KTERU|nr:hypothetical protein [Ktedonosporobacter rubrisoli]QBD78370.1 hypothetical protein EPA93_21155 [Ktedonosporobacter rubrisoli]
MTLALSSTADPDGTRIGEIASTGCMLHQWEPLACSDGTWHQMKFVRRNNRQLHKATIRKGGLRQRNTAPKYVRGFRLFDCVRYQGKSCFVFGRRSTGYFDLRKLDGTKVHASASARHLTLMQRASACLIERRSGIPPTAEPVDILPPKP